MNSQVSQLALRLGDDRLVLGHRLSEWCGHAPILEEDIALANIALDLIGEAQAFLNLAGELEGRGRDADKLTYFRDEREFTNLQLVEQPNGDFADTLVKQYLFHAFSNVYLEGLEHSKHPQLAALAAKSLKESRYHLRHTREWMLRLGDGTEESHARVQKALNQLWSFTGELFEADEIDLELAKAQMAPDLAGLKSKWQEIVKATLNEATLSEPDPKTFMQKGSRAGVHSEYLGHMLAEMQILPRSYPDAKW